MSTFIGNVIRLSVLVMCMSAIMHGLTQMGNAASDKHYVLSGEGRLVNEQRIINQGLGRSPALGQ